jgi:Ser/Thr protein kinase RdoA (MazF antagonist)
LHKKYAVWRVVIERYRAVRPIAAADLEAAHLFVPIRHIWLIGEYAGRIDEWGEALLTWLNEQAEFPQSWEAERLSPGLL